MTDDESGHYSGNIRIRTIGQITSGEESRTKAPWAVQIDHIYFSGACGHGPVDPGSVGLAVASAAEDDSAADPEPVSAIMSPEQALLVADRLTRAAQLVLAAQEEPDDAERELLRLTTHEEEA
jgi:hypothetical protein